MSGYLVDANVPINSNLWKSIGAQFVLHKDSSLADSSIWEWAKEEDLIIITKDADFSQRILYVQPPPRVVHLKIGNMRLKEFNKWVEKVWPEVERLIIEHKLVNVYLNRIEGVK